MRASGALTLAFGLMLAPAAQAQEPLSAIDWLEAPSVPVTRVAPKPTTPEPPTTQSATTPDVTTSTLGDSTSDAVGLLPTSVTGLPASLWQNSDARTLAAKIAALDVARLPAMQSLLYTLLLAEAEPPLGPVSGALLKARTDKLAELGAIEPALALVERAGASTPPLFQRWFDLSLLAGQEEHACNALMSRPYLAPDYMSRVFCTARSGDWAAAALTLETARALSLMSKGEEHLMALFLDPEMVESTPQMPPPSKITPLVFRLQEAIGAPLPTAHLPRAFAMADLRDTSGWKAELEAAERLASVGAISENRLLGYYTARLPAASGGIWDRVEALQRFDTALSAGDPAAVGAALARAWAAAQAAALEIPFARLYGAKLQRLPLTGAARALAFEVALLAPEYEAAANGYTTSTTSEKFRAGLAKGQPLAGDATTPLERAIAAAFLSAKPPQEAQNLLDAGKLGEMILCAIEQFSSAAAGNTQDVTEALASFRAIGLEDTARQAALQLLLLKRVL